MIKQVLAVSLCLAGALFINSTKIEAAEYNYDIWAQNSWKSFYAYTYAPGNGISTTANANYILTDGKTVKAVKYTAGEGINGYAEMNPTVPAGGNYYTKVVGSFKVGKNVYTKTILNCNLYD